METKISRNLFLLFGLLLAILFSCEKETHVQSNEIESNQSLVSDRQEIVQSLVSEELEIAKIINSHNKSNQSKIVKNIDSKYIKHRSDLSEKSGKTVVEVYPTGEVPIDEINIQHVTDSLGLLGVDATIILKSRNLNMQRTAFKFSDEIVQGGGFPANVRILGASMGQGGNISYIGENTGNFKTTINGALRNEIVSGVNQSIAFYIEDRPSVSFENINFKNGAAIKSIHGGLGSILVENCFFDNILQNPISLVGVNNSIEITNNEFIRYGGYIFLVNNPANTLVDNNIIKANLNYTPATGSGGGLFFVDQSGIISNNEISTNGRRTSLLLGPFNNNYKVDVINNNLYGEQAVIDLLIFDEQGSLFIDNNQIRINNDSTTFLSRQALWFKFGENAYGHDIVISNNHIKGTGGKGISINRWTGTSSISGVTVACNNFSGFKSVCSFDICYDISFSSETSDFFFCGKGLIGDFGVNNVVLNECPFNCE
ncbi:MAG: hypothetical protein ABJJ25_13925 [Eudoraea sp.]|uniref:hypothetical protein n=1 Tax=Eudoraea sp. TaxID=1979955 RepID=UPI003267E78E